MKQPCLTFSLNNAVISNSIILSFCQNGDWTHKHTVRTSVTPTFHPISRVSDEKSPKMTGIKIKTNFCADQFKKFEFNFFSNVGETSI